MSIENLHSVYPLPAVTLYTYTQMVDELNSIQAAYPDLIEIGIVGHSIEGRPLWSASLGKGEKMILLIGASHAREWLTTPLLVRTVKSYAREYSRNGTVDGYPVRPILDQYTILFVPMQNPDGVILSQFGLASVPPEKHEQLLSMKTIREDNFTRWKANLAGVDLNRQHSAGPGGWAMYNSTNPENPGKPWFQNYPGPGPESEPESQAIASLIRLNNFEMVLTYHSAGEMLFWYYFQDEYSAANMQRDLRIVKEIADYSKYRIYAPYNIKTRDRNFGAHLTAWVVHDKKIPCITVEIGNFTTSYLDLDDLPGVWLKTRALPLVAIQQLPGFQATVTSPPAPAPGTGSISANSGSSFSITGKKDLSNRFMYKTYNIRITPEPADGGIAHGGGDYLFGSHIIVKAIPREGYHFSGWKESGADVSRYPEYKFTVLGSRTLIAVFETDPSSD